MPTKPNPNYNPVIEKANKYDNYSNKAVPYVLPPNAGTSSRAYANARGAQAGLNVPNSTRATQGQVQTIPSGYQAAATAKLSGGGSPARSSGGGSGGVAAPADPGFVGDVADLSKNPIPGYYDALLAYVQQNAAGRPAINAAMGEKFQQNYDQSTKGLYDAYMGSRQGTDASAVALGVDPAIVSQARDIAMRKNQERSDQDLAANKDWLTKMGGLGQQQAEAYGNMYAGEKASKSAEWAQLEEQRVAQLNLLKLQALVDAQNAKKGSGGGGGRRKGGGSSSGSISTTATDTSTSKYGGADAAYMQSLIDSGDFEGAALFQNQMNLTEGNPGLKSVQQGINDRVAATHLSSGHPVLPNNSWYKGGSPQISKYVASPEYSTKYAPAKIAAKELPVFQRILPGMMGISSIGNSVTNTKKVTNTAKGRS